MIIVSFVDYEQFDIIGWYNNLNEVKKNADAILELKKRFVGDICITKYYVKENGLFDYDKIQERRPKTKQDILDIKYD